MCWLLPFCLAIIYNAVVGVHFVGCLCVDMSCIVLRICLTALLFQKTRHRRKEGSTALNWKRVGLWLLAVAGAGAAAATAKENNKRQQAIVCWQLSQQKWLFDFGTHWSVQICLVACVAIRRYVCERVCWGSWVVCLH